MAEKQKSPSPVQQQSAGYEYGNVEKQPATYASKPQSPYDESTNVQQQYKPSGDEYTSERQIEPAPIESTNVYDGNYASDPTATDQQQYQTEYDQQQYDPNYTNDGYTGQYDPQQYVDPQQQPYDANQMYDQYPTEYNNDMYTAEQTYQQQPVEQQIPPQATYEPTPTPTTLNKQPSPPTSGGYTESQQSDRTMGKEYTGSIGKQQQQPQSTGPTNKLLQKQPTKTDSLQSNK